VTLVNKKSGICGSNNNTTIDNTNKLICISRSNARPSLKLYKY
jgi:hypothetical protein